jgi:hypothetical protein
MNVDARVRDRSGGGVARRLIVREKPRQLRGGIDNELTG